MRDMFLLKNSRRITNNHKNRLNIITMKIYEALYCCCIHESAYATISLHKTKKGAEKAVREHKKLIKKEWDDSHKGNSKEAKYFRSRFKWNGMVDWDIKETELND